MSDTYDVLIRGAEVYDGQASAPALADVGIEGDRIVALGSLDARNAREEVDAEGLALAPGFIDVHTHDDYAVLSHPDMGFKSRGGVTTCIVGNCGFGAAPFEAAHRMLGSLTSLDGVEPYQGHAGYAERVDAIGPGINIGVLAGHGTLRMAAMGRDERAPKAGEMRQMKASLREALDAGVLGMSSGLIYDPGRNARTEELIELASEMQGSGALYATHMRDEGLGLCDSVAEAIEIGSKAGVAVQISHHKASGHEAWGTVGESLKLIEAAQGRGESVHADQYPYTAGSTMLRAILDNGAFAEERGSGGIGAVRPADVVIASAPGHARWEGESVEALAAQLACSPLAACEQVLSAAPGATAVLHMMAEADVQQVLAHPSTMIGSDGIPTLDGRPHPRLYNSFARVLGHYARDLGVFDLATAVHRMTGFAAWKFGLAGRGEVTEGAFADLVIFDPKAVIDRGTFEDPNRYPDGIRDVFVNGVGVVRHGAQTPARGGRILRRLS